MSRTGLLLLLSVALSACGSGEPATGPVVTVYHRCGDLNFDLLEGYYGRLEGDSGVNSRWRLRFERDGDAVTLKYVGGNAERTLLAGTRTGNETMTFDEVGGPADPSGAKRRMKASMTTDCRLQLDQFAVRGAGEQPVEGGEAPNRFVPLSELQRLDFEPCTEPVYTGAAAKSASRAKDGLIRPSTPPVVRSDVLPVGTFGPASEVPSGCTPVVDLYVNGEAEVADLPIGDASGGQLNWRVDFDVSYVGVQHLALHRKAICGEQAQLLGVACTVIEVP